MPSVPRVAGTPRNFPGSQSSGAGLNFSKRTPEGMGGGAVLGSTGIKVFKPEDSPYNAKRDGVSDDSAAIKACIADAVAAAISTGTYYAIVQFSAGVYNCLTPTLGGATRGNALVPLPIIEPATGQKVTLVLLGMPDGAPFLHWNQTVPQKNGAVIRAGAAAAAPDGTWGSPSIIGGPTALLNSGEQFSNMRLIISGLLLVAPKNPGYIAVDGRRVAQMDVPNAGALAEGVVSDSAFTAPNNSNGIGFYFPRPDNNDSSNVGVLSVEGFYYGVAFADHFVAQRLGIIYANTAIFINDSDGGSIHGAAIQYASIEAVATVLEMNGSATGQYPVEFGAINAEVVTSTRFKDTQNALRGYIKYGEIAGTTPPDPTVSGCANVKIINVFRAPGAIAAPALPATTVASTPIYRDMALTVSGGTVTAISVDGQSLGVTSGTVFVPSGKSFAITYSVAPTLKATLL